MSFPDKTEQKHRLVQVQLFEINKIKEILNIQRGVFTSVPVTGRHFFANTFILQYFNFVSWNISSGQLSTNKIERYKQKEEVPSLKYQIQQQSIFPVPLRRYFWQQSGQWTHCSKLQV